MQLSYPEPRQIPVTLFLLHPPTARQCEKDKTSHSHKCIHKQTHTQTHSHKCMHRAVEHGRGRGSRGVLQGGLGGADMLRQGMLRQGMVRRGMLSGMLGQACCMLSGMLGGMEGQAWCMSGQACCMRGKACCMRGMLHVRRHVRRAIFSQVIAV